MNTIDPPEPDIDANGVRLWRAGAEDIEQLAPLVRAYWQFDEIPAPRGTVISDTLTQWLARDEHCACWMAGVDGEPVGYLLAVFVFSLEHLGLTAEIDECYVLPGHRRRGLGASLIRLAEQGFRERGCTNSSLQVARLNEQGKRFYRRLGYGCARATS
ncbi:MAG: GNAT family N-acetyltransferase [Burkholderiaceae bacterium]